MVNLKSLLIVTAVLSILFVPLIYEDFEFEGIFPELNLNNEGDYSEAQLNVELGSVDSANIGIIEGDLILQDLTDFESGDTDITSDENIIFIDFTGDVSFTNSKEVSVIGEAKGVETSNVEISDDLDLDFESSAEYFEVKNMSGENYFFENSSYNLSTNSSTLNGIGNSSFERFQGNLTVKTNDMDLEFIGGFNSFKSGKFSFN